MFYLVLTFLMISGALIKWVERPAIPTTEYWKGHRITAHSHNLLSSITCSENDHILFSKAKH